MSKILLVFQIIISVLLIAVILVQSKGAGLTSSSSNDNFNTLRGPEKAMFIAIVILVILFLLSSFVNVLIY